MKLEVGKKYRLRNDDNIIDLLDMFVGFVEEMREFLGAEVTITECYDDYGVYIKEDGGNFCWYVDCFEEIKQEYAVGSTTFENEVIMNAVFTGDVKPHYGKVGDSAMDLYAYQYKTVSNGQLSEAIDFTEDGYILQPHERILVTTGLKIEYIQEVDASLRPRSGLSLKHGIMAILGTLDNNYRGDTGIILLNTSNEPYTVHKDDRLGQIRFSKPVKVALVYADSLEETNRGEKGFGESGR